MFPFEIWVVFIFLLLIKILSNVFTFQVQFLKQNNKNL